MRDKNSLREHFRAVRRAADRDGQRSAWDSMMTERFLATEEYRSCSQLLCYVSGEIEVGTGHIIQHALENGKTVLAPRCVKGTNIMHFYRICSREDLEAGLFGIEEPREYCERYDSFDNAVCVVPGLSFDTEGYRLGFGKGFYDRFLADLNGVSIGLCYENCISERLPADEYDMRVDKIVTENRTIEVKKG